uniref:Uncharacterized protein n=1 Tax=uncultured bacterium contig00104 TaxID=1181571 RepID=A0A806K360_9BACT|nr:hypothetical protein [uncultured bacterium contig00104]
MFFYLKPYMENIEKSTFALSCNDFSRVFSAFFYINALI